MSDSLLILGVRLAGALHFVTLVLDCFTPIPPDWEKNLVVRKATDHPLDSRKPKAVAITDCTDDHGRQ